jgi:hypothetical protein
MSTPVNPVDTNPEVRKVLYLIQWVISGVSGVLGIVLAANSGGVDSMPGWYVTANLVLAFIWTYTGLTAQSNVAKQVQITHAVQGPDGSYVITGAEPGTSSS